MIDYKPLYKFLESVRQREWAEKLQQQIPAILSAQNHGDLEGWLQCVQNLPDIKNVQFDFNKEAVTLSTSAQLNETLQNQLISNLKELHPWRKGPFNFFGIEVDAEWRSNLKWNRLKDAIKPLQGKKILDIGCGNGYYGWRMLGAGAEMVIGVEPFLKHIMQYLAVLKYTGSLPFHILPIGVEDLPQNLDIFDTVFSMGVLYHRRSPFDHLYQLKSFLKPGGQLVLETIVIEGNAGNILVPQGRYAKMRNVWFLPAVDELKLWLKRTGFRNIELIDVTKTTTNEQRKTEWMTFESLENFLNPIDHNLTIEGLPAPQRAIITAEV